MNRLFFRSAGRLDAFLLSATSPISDAAGLRVADHVNDPDELP